MPRNNSSLTIPATETGEIQTQSKSGIARRKKEETIILDVPQAQASLIQELELSFDSDLRLAMIQRLISAKKDINSLVYEEEKLAKTIELSTLVATEKARLDGIQKARAEFAAKMKKNKQQEQQTFIKNELPELISACDVLSAEEMRQTVEVFAARLDIKIQWEETDEGLQYTAVPN
nr:hypothetical protein [Nostoc sp. EkiNYC01]